MFVCVWVWASSFNTAFLIFQVVDSAVPLATIEDRSNNGKNQDTSDEREKQFNDKINPDSDGYKIDHDSSEQKTTDIGVSGKNCPLSENISVKEMNKNIKQTEKHSIENLSTSEQPVLTRNVPSSASEQSEPLRDDKTPSLESSLNKVIDTSVISDPLDGLPDENTNMINKKMLDNEEIVNTRNVLESVDDKDEDTSNNAIAEKERANIREDLSGDILQGAEGDVTAKFLFSFGATCLERLVVVMLAFFV